MKLNDKYVNKIATNDIHPKFGGSIIGTKLIHISDNSRGRLYENITRIDFNAMYAYTMIGLFNECLIGKEWKEDIERVQWFLKNRADLKRLSPGEYQKWKTHCNSLYDKIKSPYVVEYVDMFYTDLIQKYGDLIIYNDVDTLYLNIDKISFQSKEWISELKDFSYDVQFINYFYAEDIKEYIEQEESGQVNTYGFKDEVKILNLVKREIRRRKLEKLGI
jgi:hypothetical protein